MKTMWVLIATALILIALLVNSPEVFGVLALLIITALTSGDFGADIIFEKEGVKYCAQCKMYSNPVGVSAVQEVVTAKAHYQCERAMVITNSTFAAQAKKLASENSVILVDEFT